DRLEERLADRRVEHAAVGRLADRPPAEQGRRVAGAGGVDEVHPQPPGELGDERRVVRFGERDDFRPLSLDHRGDLVEPAGAAVEDVVADDPEGHGDLRYGATAVLWASG